MKKTKILLCATACLAAATTTALGAELTYPDLVNRLTDLKGLARLPQPGERCAQWSSYDRASRYDPRTGKYIHWDANGDGGGYIRKEGDSFVLAEMKGPGCIWRIWSALPKEGHVRMWLDGAEKPTVDLPFRAWFDRSTPPFTREALVHTVARGWNNYTPIPYQKSCKIVADKGWGAYYQIVYSSFPKGTKLPTFRLPLSAEDEAALDRANRILLHCGPKFPRDTLPDLRVERHRISVSGGGEAKIVIPGPRAIRTIRMRIDLPGGPKDRVILREHTIQIRWDGERSPSVWAPLGDFFGTAAGANPYRSLPAGLTKDGWWYCHWYMPFAKEAEITLRNDGAEPRPILLEIEHVAAGAEASRLARFHAKWHRDAFLPKEPERRIDWTLLKTRGRGRFVGALLHVWNPRGAWWGEGDEKFFVDGEKFPSTFGTGSEDYFGYAWCNPTLFENAFHNQTLSMNNKGHVSVNRWHIADNVPFMKSFEGCIEKYFPNSRPTLYAATVYWYLASDGEDPYQPAPVKERASYWDESMLQTWRVKGALEGEKLRVLQKTGGVVQRQDMSFFEGRWSGDAHLWWTGAKPGDKLTLAIPVAKAGRYALKARLTKAVDYGVVRVFLDDKPLGKPIDLYNNGVVATPELDWGVHQLDRGTRRLTIQIVGANPKAVKSYMFGLDYVRLVPQ